MIVGYWSIVCHATREVYVREADTVLGPGMNVFTVVTPDLDKLTGWLETQGVTLKWLHKLDDHVSITFQSPESLFDEALNIK